MKIDLSKVKPNTEGKVVMSIDPGDHIGIIIQDRKGVITGGTIIGAKRNLYMYQLMIRVHPDIVCFEQFALRASMAKKLAGNKFFTCEVIGVIKMYCFLYKLDINEIFPGSKEYCGFSDKPQDPHYQGINVVKFEEMECENKITEHVRDAYRLYSYYKLFGVRFK